MLPTGEIKTLLLRLSFAHTPRSDIFNFERDLYRFSRKVRLKYHFADSSNTDTSLVKLPSGFTPARNKHQELEHVLRPVENLYVGSRRGKDNISENRNDLQNLIERTKKNEIIIKPADKGEIIVIQSALDYRNMCMKHLQDPEFFADNGQQDPSQILQERVKSFAEKYERMVPPR